MPLDLPDTCRYSPEERRLADLFAERIRRLGQTEAEAGADIGYSAGSVSTLLGGKTNSPAHILRAIKKLLTAEHRRAATVQQPEWVETDLVRRIYGYCRGRRDGGQMGYICGAPGVGRTQALQHIAAENDDAHVISVPAGVTPMRLLKAIAAAVRLHVGEKATRLELRDELIAKLKGTPGGLLIIDEADRMALDVADTARDLWDESGCGQVWSGTNRLLSYLDRHTDSLAGQVRRRLRDVLYLPGLDDGELAVILAQYPDWPDDLRDYAVARARGNTARLCVAVHAARTVVGGRVPSRRNLEDAFLAIESQARQPNK